MIGFIIAEKEETANLVKTIKAKTIEFNGTRFYVGNVDDKQVLMCFCGIGKTNAAAAAMSMIINFNVEAIFNIGLCGSTRPNIPIGSTLIANKTEYFDVDLVALNYALNQVPNEPTYFEIKEKYVNLLKQILPDAIIGTVATGDTFVTINNIESFPSLSNKEIVGIDMEAAVIAQVCARTKTDFFCAKIVSDNMTFDIESEKTYHAGFKDLSKKIEKICLNITKNF